MNSKNLIISFVTVSVASLIVSAFAVFAVARRYAAELSEKVTEATVATSEITEMPDESIPDTISTAPPETEEESPDTTVEEDLTVSVTAEITEAQAVTSASETFSLSLSGDRLVISDPSGETVYERIIDSSSLHKKDREKLIAGIEYPDKESAMSAVYDLIS